MSRSAKSTPRQLPLRRRPPRTWGGWRPGAGRPRKPGAEQKVARERFSRPTVAHVTTRVCDDVPSLRGGRLAQHVATALWESALAEGFRLVHFSIQSNHLHLIVEAAHWRNLSKGMQLLQVRVARTINRMLRRSGTVFAQRYHAHLLRTPTQVRNALRYVLMPASRSAGARSDSAARRPSRSDGEGHNRRRHQGERQAQPGWVDPLSTARWFDGYRDRQADGKSPLPRARTFLLCTGWRRGRGGRFSVDDVPGRCRAP